MPMDPFGLSMENLALQRSMEKDAFRRRPRAVRACIRCNNRKVRCDMLNKPFKTANNAPSRCTNCRLDDEPCIVRPTKRRRGASYRYDAPVDFNTTDGEKALLDISSSMDISPIQDTSVASGVLPSMEYVPERMPCANLNSPSYYGEAELLTTTTNFEESEAICSINGMSTFSNASLAILYFQLLCQRRVLILTDDGQIFSSNLKMR